MTISNETTSNLTVYSTNLTTSSIETTHTQTSLTTTPTTKGKIPYILYIEIYYKEYFK